MQSYIDEKKEMYKHILLYLENSNDQEIIFIRFQKNIEKYFENKEDFKLILQLITHISINHYRNIDFHEKITKIIHFLENQIKQFFSDFEIFNIFKSSKLILLYLLEKSIISLDEKIINQILIQSNNFYLFFYSEITKFNENQYINELLFLQDQTVFENFDEKRHEGENDSYICKLIRNDSVEDFISYVNKTNYSLSNKIKPSIYDTHSFLIDKSPTLIEYSAFFGSLQIFQYLKLNNVELSPSLWLYVIHSNNAELIHILESMKIEPPNQSFIECFLESIKCHHNDVAHYIEDNLLPIDKNKIYQNDQIKEDIFSCILHSRNFEFFPNEFNESYQFFYLCSNEYHTLVNFFIKQKEKLIKSSIIKIINN